MNLMLTWSEWLSYSAESHSASARVDRRRCFRRCWRNRGVSRKRSCAAIATSLLRCLWNLLTCSELRQVISTGMRACCDTSGMSEPAYRVRAASFPEPSTSAVSRCLMTRMSCWMHVLVGMITVYREKRMIVVSMDQCAWTVRWVKLVCGWVVLRTSPATVFQVLGCAADRGDQTSKVRKLLWRGSEQ